MWTLVIQKFLFELPIQKLILEQEHELVSFTYHAHNKSSYGPN
jgi:hypothetical protein